MDQSYFMYMSYILIAFGLYFSLRVIKKGIKQLLSDRKLMKDQDRTILIKSIIGQISNSSIKVIPPKPRYKVKMRNQSKDDPEKYEFNIILNDKQISVTYSDYSRFLYIKNDEIKSFTHWAISIQLTKNEKKIIQDKIKNFNEERIMKFENERLQKSTEFTKQKDQFIKTLIY